jgi:hypothetical protein
MEIKQMNTLKTTTTSKALLGGSIMNDFVVQEYINLLIGIKSTVIPEKIQFNSEGEIKEVYPESIQVLIDTIQTDLKKYLKQKYNVQQD